MTVVGDIQDLIVNTDRELELVKVGGMIQVAEERRILNHFYERLKSMTEDESTIMNITERTITCPKCNTTNTTVFPLLFLDDVGTSHYQVQCRDCKRFFEMWIAMPAAIGTMMREKK